MEWLALFLYLCGVVLCKEFCEDTAWEWECRPHRLRVWCACTAWPLCVVLAMYWKAYEYLKAKLNADSTP